MATIAAGIRAAAQIRETAVRAAWQKGLSRVAQRRGHVRYVSGGLAAEFGPAFASLLHCAHVAGVRLDAIAPRVEAAGSSGGGAGYVALSANRPLNKGEEVLRLPRAAWEPLSAEALADGLDQHGWGRDLLVALDEWVASEVSGGGAGVLPAGVEDYGRRLERLRDSVVVGMGLAITRAGGAEAGGGALWPAAAGDADGAGAALARAYAAWVPGSLNERPMFWSTAERRRELQRCGALRDTMDQLGLLQRLHRDVISRGGKDLPAAARISLLELAWSQSTVVSHMGVMGDGIGSMPLTLLPIVDLLPHANERQRDPVPLTSRARTGRVLRRYDMHGADEYGDGDLQRDPTPGACHVRFDGVAGDFVVESLAMCDVGTPLRVSYGELGNARLLRTHGCTIRDNPYDTVSIAPSWAKLNAPDTALGQVQARLLAEHGVPVEGGFDALLSSQEAMNAALPETVELSAMQPLPAPLLAMLRIAVMVPDDLLMAPGQSARGTDPAKIAASVDPTRPISGPNEAVVMNVIGIDCLNTARAYGTTLEEDRLALHKSDEAGGVVSDDEEDTTADVDAERAAKLEAGRLRRWHQDCIVLRIGEKQILADALDAANRIRSAAALNQL